MCGCKCGLCQNEIFGFKLQNKNLGSNLYNLFNLILQFKRALKFGFLSSFKKISYVFLVNKFYYLKPLCTKLNLRRFVALRTVCVGPKHRMFVRGPPVESHIASETLVRRRSPPTDASVGTARLCNTTFHILQKLELLAIIVCCFGHIIGQ